MAVSHADVLTDAADRLKESVDGWTETWALARLAQDFVDDPDTQWPSDIAARRRAKGQPCLVVPVLPTMVLQVENEGLQDLPAMQVSPVDDRADVQTAQILQGILRHVEQRSRADIAYGMGFRPALKIGFGFLRYYTERANPWSKEQEVVIRGVPDPFRVQYDPYFQEPDGSDADFAFYSEELSEARYKILYPGREIPSGEEMATGMAYTPSVHADSVTLREYWQRRTKTVKVVVLSDGSVYDADTLQPSWVAASGLEVHGERDAEVPTVCWYKMTATDILEESEWELDCLPILPVLGREIVVKGKRLYCGLVRDAMDVSRAINYWTSAATELLALAPKNPYIAAAGQIEDYADEWKRANRDPQAVLRYKPTSNAGQPVPPPQRQTFDVQIDSVMAALTQAHEDLRTVTGVYPAQAGAPSNETSAAAIERRIVQAQTTNAQYKNRLAGTVRQGCRVALQLIRQTYDTARVARILGEDGRAQQVPVNQPFMENGVQRIYDLQAGQYDVVPGTGRSYNSRRDEARAAMQEFVKQNPSVASPKVMAAIAKYSDWPGAEEFEQIFTEQSTPSQAEQQKDAQIGELTQKIHHLESGIDIAKIKAATDERIELIKQETALLAAEVKAADATAMEDLKAQLAVLGARVEAWDTTLSDQNLTPGTGGGEAAGPTGQGEPEAVGAGAALGPPEAE